MVTWPSLALTTTKCRSANAATWARWVTTITWACWASVGQPATDLERDRAADTGVDLVEDQRRPVADSVGQHDLQGQPDPGQLAAGRGPGQAARLAARVRGEQKLDLVGPVRAEIAAGRVRTQPGVRHGQRGEFGTHPLAELGRRPSRRVVTVSRERRQFGVQLGRSAAGKFGDPLVGGSSRPNRSAACAAQASTSAKVAPYLPGEAGQRGAAFRDLFQPAGLGLQMVQVAGQVGGQSVTR